MDDARGDKKKGMTRRTFLLGGGAAASSMAMAGAFYLEPRALQTLEISLPLAKIPPGRELRLVHLSDLHVRTFTGYYREVARQVNELDADAILLTGDYLERGRNIWEVREFLQILKAREGIYAVQGNWDYWARLEGENLRRHFARCGVTLLINERADLEFQDVPISVLGLDYPSTADDLSVLQSEADPARLNLLLSHVPAFAHELLDGRIDLILCGHTHGGQLRLPLLPPFYLPRFSGHFVEGLFHVGPDDTPLYVTRGIGTSVLPARLFCRPEITLLRLRAV